MSDTAESGDRTMGMLCHLLGIFTSFIGPLVIWLIKKDESAFVNDQGKEALNFQISIILYYIISFILVFVVIGIFMIWAVGIFSLVMCIIAAVKANGGEMYRYPLCIRLIK